MTEKEKKHAESVIIKNTVNFRGWILHDVVLLERILDTYICNHFCDRDEKKKEFLDLILGNSRISFDGKRKLFFDIIEHLDDNVHKKFTGFTKDWNDVIRHRNIFAHHMVDFSEEALLVYKTKVGFIKFGKNALNQKNVEWYDFKKIRGVQDAVHRCIKIMKFLTFGEEM